MSIIKNLKEKISENNEKSSGEISNSKVFILVALRDKEKEEIGFTRLNAILYIIKREVGLDYVFNSKCKQCYWSEGVATDLRRLVENGYVEEVVDEVDELKKYRKYKLTSKGENMIEVYKDMVEKEERERVKKAETLNESFSQHNNVKLFDRLAEEYKEIRKLKGK